MDFISGFFRLAWTKVAYLFEGSYTYDVAITIAELIGQLWYFFVIGILATAAIQMFWNRQSVARLLGRSVAASVIGAAVIGVVSPMPTYVAIPLVVALFSAGVPIPVLFAFLVSSPLMNPVLFTLTAGAFGYPMAIARLIAALSLGISAGLAANLLVRKQYLKGLTLSASGLGASVLRPDNDTGFSLRGFAHASFRLTRWAGKYFLLGILVAALVKNLVPAQLMVSAVGGNTTLSVLAAVAAGVPLYACGGGTIPVMQALMALGLNKGAVLAFFISGPATKLSTLVALKAAVLREAFLLYLVVGLFGATIMGLIYSIW